MTLNEDSKRLISLLIESGYRAYAVGGCVRDSILKKEVSDIDITTSALPEETEAVLEKSKIKYFETGLKHGTITAVLNGENYEITTFRSDGEYLDNRHPESVEFVDSLKDDLSRRDFTVNALAYNEEEGIVDLFGGLEDIKNKVIRAVGNPTKRFNEDALRIMRAVRFSAVLGFEIESETKKAMFENKELLLNVAFERNFVELKKLLCGDYAEQALTEYRDIIAVLIPELKPCFDFPQNSKWHIYDVYTHIVKAVSSAPETDYIRFALLLHDIAKPDCKITDELGFDHFKGHPEKSMEYAQEILKRFKVSNDFKFRILKLIEIHDVIISEKRSNIKKWMRILGKELLFDYFEIRLADLNAHNPERSEPEIESLKKVRETALDILEKGEPYRVCDLAVDGRDLLNIGFMGSEVKDELDLLISVVSGSPELNSREWLIKRASADFRRIN